MPVTDPAGFGLFVRQAPKSALLPSVLALLAGALQAASLSWPFLSPQGWFPARGQPVWWLQLMALTVLVHLLLRAVSARQAAWRAWLFALAWLALTFSWLFTSMHTYGGLPAPLAVLAVLALAGALALYYAGVCWVYKALAQEGCVLSATIFASLWLLAELARGQWLSGFGWGAMGYAQLDGPLAPMIGWAGLYGVSALAAAVAALLAVALSARGWPARSGCIAMALALLGLPQGLPTAPGADHGSLRVTLLQGNIAQDEKFEQGTGVPKALNWYRAQLTMPPDTNSALIITPETAVPLLPEELPEGYWQALAQRFESGQTAALVGVPLGNSTQGYTNSVVGFKPGQSMPWRYDKHHLVPFGEFIPPFFRWFTNLMNIPLGDFNRGTLSQPGFEWQGQRLATSICYENLFTEELATQFANPALAPTLLVNISNLGWFGEHLAMDQHLQIARMRSLEFDRPFLLATNTGQTAIVNHRGQVTHAAAPHTVAALSAQVQGRTGTTPYASWVARFGLWPLWILALAVVMLAGLVQKQQRRS